MDKTQQELKTFTFDLKGHDVKPLFVGKFQAVDLEHALKEARKRCKHMALPGWVLSCREEVGSFAAIQFLDSEKKTKTYK